MRFADILVPDCFVRCLDSAEVFGCLDIGKKHRWVIVASRHYFKEAGNHLVDDRAHLLTVIKKAPHRIQALQQLGFCSELHIIDCLHFRYSFFAALASYCRTFSTFRRRFQKDHYLQRFHD